MNKLNAPDSTRPPATGRSRWTPILVGGSLLVVLLAFLSRRQLANPASGISSDKPGPGTSANSAMAERAPRFARPGKSAVAPAQTAEEIVASKVLQFGRNRRELVRTIARRTQKEVPLEIEQFFDAVESGEWDQIKARWDAMANRSGQYEGSRHAPELDPFWPSVLDAYGVAEQAHDWPAQKLLDYGNAILDSLRPGMVYVGGTDPGRWIPELLNETSSGEQHIIVTQNAFADGRYLEFMNTLYGNRFAALTEGDSKRAFDEYIADAQKRLEHDRQFPDEPKQLRPGEDVRVVDGKVQVSGHIAVMSINEKLLQSLMEKNPELSFAMEESYPFKSMFGNATSLGPIMELGVHEEQSALTQERATQAVDYWRATAQQLLADSEAADSLEVRKAYAKLAASQGGLLLERGYTAEAEQAFRSANEIAPTSTEAVFRYVNLLVTQSRIQDAIPVADNALRLEPGNSQFRNLLEELNRLNKK